MGYHVIDPDALEPAPDRPCDQRRVAAAAGCENFGLNRYVAAPGEQVPLAYHSHDAQEEAFVVVDGPLHVETPEGEFVVNQGEVFVAEPTSPHRAYNPATADGPVTVFAVGAPAVDDASAYEGDGA